jgi:hypothetical protein
MGDFVYYPSFGTLSCNMVYSISRDRVINYKTALVRFKVNDEGLTYLYYGRRKDGMNEIDTCYEAHARMVEVGEEIGFDIKSLKTGALCYVEETDLPDVAPNARVQNITYDCAGQRGDTSKKRKVEPSQSSEHSDEDVLPPGFSSRTFIQMNTSGRGKPGAHVYK